jgi:hypothetical protein
VDKDYRGHLIRLIETDRWSAELVELRSGALLPTTVSATADEGEEICAERARCLIDLYLDAQAERDRRRRFERSAGRPFLRLIRP